MANFRKRGELQWQPRIRRKGYPDQVKTLNTRAEAEEWARAIEHQIDRGAFVKPGRGRGNDPLRGAGPVRV